MQDKSLVGILFFLIATTIIYEIGGGKPTVYFLFLVIMSILVVNTNKIKSLI